MSQRFLAAAIQLCASSDKAANFAVAARLARAAAERGAALIVLPELFFWRGPRDDEPAAAEPIPGPTTERLAALAAELRVHLVGLAIAFFGLMTVLAAIDWLVRAQFIAPPDYAFVWPVGLLLWFIGIMSANHYYQRQS